jgi:autotransporter-associated beta strand protein
MNPAGGDWLNATNWSGGNIAFGSGNTADFSALTLASNVTVTLDSAWSIGRLAFDDHAATPHAWTLQADDALTLDNGGSAPQIATAAPIIFDLPLAGDNGFQKSGDSSLTLLGANNFSAGQISVTGGSLNFAGDSSLSGKNNFNVSNGVVNLNTTSALAIANYLELGGLYNDATDAGSGVVNQIAGTANIGGSGIYLEIGVGANAFGAYNLFGGSLNTLNSSGIRVGASGVGLFHQSGGNLDCARYFAVGSATAGASSGGGRGVATFTGGVATLGSANYRVILGDKPGTTAVLNIGTAAGGDALVTSASTSSGNWGVEFLDVSGATMSAVLNLNHGTLQTVGPLWRNTANNKTGAAYLNFNGGVLQAGADQANFITNALTAVNVFRGGAVVDTQNFQVTNAAPLVNAPGQGIYPAGGTLSVPAGGSGYLASPWVTVSGGSGSNAQAIASVVNGTITGVTLTCPGQNYQAGDVIRFSFTGGGAATAAGDFDYTLSAGDVAANGVGGLTKLGAGSLTLLATNTFAGDTTVSGGTLNLAGSLSGGGNVSVGNGVLSGNGFIAGAVTVNGGGALAPGADAPGRLTIGNRLTLLRGAACRFRLDKALGMNDSVQGLTQVNFGGTLMVSNLNTSLAAGDSFKLFYAADYTGGFEAIVPAAPGAGLAWDTRRLRTDGILGVRAVNTTSTNLAIAVTGDDFQISWPEDHTGWRLQMQVNDAATGLSTNWVDVADSINTNRMTFALNQTHSSMFLRLIYP